MTSAASPLRPGALGTQARAFEEEADESRAWSGENSPDDEGLVSTSPTGKMAPGSGRATVNPQGPCRPFYHPLPAGSGLVRVPLPGARFGNQHGRAVNGLKGASFFRAGVPKEVGRSWRAFALLTGAPFRRRVHSARRRPRCSWCLERAESTRRPNPAISARSRTVALAKAEAVLLLFFFISLFHIHISHSMEKPERVRQRWYNRSAVTGAGRGGEGTNGLAAYLHSARTLKTQKTKQTVNYPCFLCISVQRRGWRAERGETRLKEEERRDGTLRGKHTKSISTIYRDTRIYCVS